MPFHEPHQYQTPGRCLACTSRKNLHPMTHMASLLPLYVFDHPSPKSRLRLRLIKFDSPNIDPGGSLNAVCA